MAHWYNQFALRKYKKDRGYTVYSNQIIDAPFHVSHFKLEWNVNDVYTCAFSFGIKEKLSWMFAYV